MIYVSEVWTRTHKGQFCAERLKRWTTFAERDDIVLVLVPYISLYDVLPYGMYMLDPSS